MDFEFSFKEADILLSRDWFLDIYDIDEFLWLLTEEVFQQVYRIRYKYSPRIRHVFTSYDPILPPIVKDMTDQDMLNKYREEELQRIQNKKLALEAYTPPPRQRNIWDEQFDDLTSKCTILQSQLAKFLSRPNYHKSTIAAMEQTLDQYKNELSRVSERVDGQNKTWKELQWIQSVVFASARPTLS